MKYRVIIQDDALRAIRAQARFIAEQQQAPRNAMRWLRQILRSAKTLENFPHRCPVAPENSHRDYLIRMLVVQGSLLLYHVDDEMRVVHVIGFRHGRQQPTTEDLPQDAP